MDVIPRVNARQGNTMNVAMQFKVVQFMTRCNTMNNKI